MKGVEQTRSAQSRPKPRSPQLEFLMEAHNGLSARIAREAGFDLARLARLQDQRDTPFSRAVQAFYTLVEALREFAGQGGRAARDQRYAHLGEQVRAGLTRLDIETMVPPEPYSGRLTEIT